MKLQIIDLKGKKSGSIDVSEKVFGIVPNLTVIAQYIRVYLANQRHGTSSTKNRAEVSGSGRKPWRQKGTGRARVGSSRTPVWRHGGISHGPRPKSWVLSLPKKIKALAVKSALSLKVSQGRILVLESALVTQPKTSVLVSAFEALKINPKRTLIVLDKVDNNLIKSASNIQGLATALAENVNAYELMLARNILFSKESLEYLNEKYEVVA